MKKVLYKDFTFDSAHKLPDYVGKCNHLHGHTYHMTVGYTAEIQKDGFIKDFVTMKKEVTELVIDKYDHAYLNDFWPNPTVEIMAEYILNVLNQFDSGYCFIRLYETPTSFIEISI